MSFQHISTLFEYNLLIYFVGLHALLIITMIFGPFGKAWLAIVSHLFFFADVLSVVQGFPVEFNHSVASVGVEKRNPTAATWTSPGKFTGVRLHSSCAGKESFFEDVLNNMVTVVSAS